MWTLKTNFYESHSVRCCAQLVCDNDGSNIYQHSSNPEPRKTMCHHVQQLLSLGVGSVTHPYLVSLDGTLAAASPGRHLPTQHNVLNDMSGLLLHQMNSPQLQALPSIFKKSHPVDPKANLQRQYCILLCSRLPPYNFLHPSRAISAHTQSHCSYTSPTVTIVRAPKQKQNLPASRCRPPTSSPHYRTKMELVQYQYMAACNRSSY